MVGDSSAVFNYYVAETATWPGIIAYETQRKNGSHFDQSTSIETRKSSSQEPIKPLWFLMPFLLSMGYLWVEGKV